MVVGPNWSATLLMEPDSVVSCLDPHRPVNVAEDDMLDAYEIDRDDDRISYYRRLWDAT